MKMLGGGGGGTCPQCPLVPTPMYSVEMLAKLFSKLKLVSFFICAGAD